MAQATQVKRDESVLLFDGVCNLCNSFVNFVLDRDAKGVIKMGSLQSEVGRGLLEKKGLNSDYFDSLVFIRPGKTYTKSRAALEVARLIGLPWSLFYVFIIVPPFLRDPVYDFVAKHRYKWFGQRETCRMPTADIKERFLDS